jgi:hypothetical protein
MKSKTLAFGVSGRVVGQVARHQDARRLLADGIDPQIRSAEFIARRTYV